MTLAFSVEKNWDGNNAEPPNHEARYWSERLLEEIVQAGLEPSGIHPSVEGGVAIYFVNEERYAVIEALNTGTVLAVLSDRKSEPRVLTMQQEGTALMLQRVADYLRGAS